MDFKVVIPAAGTGSRLGELCKYLNKSLVSVGNRPGICHIIDKFATEVPIVVALGYKGELVREFLELAYPDRIFEFVDVHPFEGPGSGLGLSLLSCRSRLQCPFVFCSCDTIVAEPIPLPSDNWMGYADVQSAAEYRTIVVDGALVSAIEEKRPGTAAGHAYIGLAGVNDYVRFWQAFDEPSGDAIGQGESFGLRCLLGAGIAAHRFQWHDTGTVSRLNAARTAFRATNAPNILPKANEDIWFVGDHVIKFSADRRFIADRVARSRLLNGYCPTIDGAGTNMYRYRRADGEVLSRIVTPSLFRNLLDHADRFWAPRALDATASVRFSAVCREFYQAKTYQRLDQFYRNFDRADQPVVINGLAVPTNRELLARIDWDWLCQGRPGNFHGDFHFENILFDEASGRFVFLDWRQDFGGLQDMGDIYYDLAKLNHGLIVCHDLIARDLFEVSERGAQVRFELLRKQSLVECEAVLADFVRTKGYDLKRVKVLTALIYLNIAALHHHPYSLLLFYLGRYLLAEQLSGSTGLRHENGIQNL